MKAVLPEQERKEKVRKADSLEKMSVEISTGESVSMVYKADDEFYIWGPASVEIVDKENDKIRVEALDKALPQLLKRARLSYAHTDQIVGRILDGFETKEDVEVEIDGEVFNRSDFPTDVLDLEEGNAPGLYVAGEVYNDTDQAQTVRKKIEEGEINSYSISGEALVTRKQVEDDQVYDDIIELDLSAVTLCEEGMNQGAKFARVNGEVDEVELADPESEVSEKSYDVESGSINSPDRTETTTQDTMSKSDNDDNDGTDSLPDNVATKSDVEETIDKQFEEKFNKRFEVHFARKSEDLTEALVDSLVDEMEKSIEEEVDAAIGNDFEETVTEKAANAVDEALPDANLATKGYIDDVVEEVVEEKLDGFEATTSEEVEEETKEEDEDDYEEEDKEDEMEGEMDDGEEGGEGLTMEDLEDQLPEDMFEVVAEYLGKEDDDDEEEVIKADEGSSIDEQVEKILSGDGVETPTPSAGGSQYEGTVEKDDQDSEDNTQDSPALENFDHR